MKALRRSLVVGVVTIVLLIAVMITNKPLRSSQRAERRRLQEQPHSGGVYPYKTADLIRTASYLHGFQPRLLVFNGQRFEVYNLRHRANQYTRQVDNCGGGRCSNNIPLFVHALLKLNPKRFRSGQPVFELLFTDADSIASSCLIQPGKCQTQSFAPIMLFGSAPANPKEMPTVKAFPTWFYLKCLYDYKLGDAGECKWTEHADRELTYEELEPTLIWRGSDFTFLPHYKRFSDFHGMMRMDWNAIDHNSSSIKEMTITSLLSKWDELPPRWRAVALSAQAELYGETWIDVKFTGAHNLETHNKFQDYNVVVKTKKHMHAKEMSRYKYQIDLGGGGGTSWRGGLTKLAMPGVLFHHKTMSKDWFYDDMEPFREYIPITWNLEDLREKIDWAEANQAQAKEIAANGQKFFDYMMSTEYMDKLYDELFVDYLGHVLDSYTPSQLSWDEIKQQYTVVGFGLHRVAHCDDTQCHSIGQRQRQVSSVPKTYSYNHVPTNSRASSHVS